MSDPPAAGRGRSRPVAGMTGRDPSDNSGDRPDVEGAAGFVAVGAADAETSGPAWPMRGEQHGGARRVPVRDSAGAAGFALGRQTGDGLVDGQFLALAGTAVLQLQDTLGRAAAA